MWSAMGTTGTEDMTGIEGTTGTGDMTGMKDATGAESMTGAGMKTDIRSDGREPLSAMPMQAR